MNTKERLAMSQEKKNTTIQAALAFSMQDIAALIRTLNKTFKNGPIMGNWTKKGPGRRHQLLSKKELMERIKLKKEAIRS